MRIALSEPIIEKEEIENALSALKNKAISGLFGKYIGKFEEEFSGYCQCRYGITANSGTTALHLAIAALGINKNDHVLVSTFTNMATFFAVLYQGAKPIPVDIESDTWNIDPDLIESKITKRTKAILIVHIYGHPCDMNPILKIAKKHRLYLIEDCAEAHGAAYLGKKVGSFGDIGCFSFYANKIISTGEGGMITTNNKKIAEKVKSLRSLAFGEKNKFMHKDIGFGYRMTNLQAAIGCAQIKKIDTIISKKREAAGYYNEKLKNLPFLQLPAEKAYAKNVYWMYNVELKENSPFKRSFLMKELAKKGIETRESFIPYNMQDIFIKRGWTKLKDCPRANKTALNGFYLPSGTNLKKQEIDYVASSIKDIFRRY